MARQAFSCQIFLYGGLFTVYNKEKFPMVNVPDGDRQAFRREGSGRDEMSEDEQIEIKVRDPDFREMIYRTCFMTINGAVFSALMEAGLRGALSGRR